MNNPNEFCFLCGVKNDLNNFAFTDIDDTFHIVCLNCKGKEWGVDIRKLPKRESE